MYPRRSLTTLTVVVPSSENPSLASSVTTNSAIASTTQEGGAGGDLAAHYFTNTTNSNHHGGLGGRHAHPTSSSLGSVVHDAPKPIDHHAPPTPTSPLRLASSGSPREPHRLSPYGNENDEESKQQRRGGGGRVRTPRKLSIDIRLATASPLLLQQSSSFSDDPRCRRRGSGGAAAAVIAHPFPRLSPPSDEQRGDEGRGGEQTEGSSNQFSGVSSPAGSFPVAFAPACRSCSPHEGGVAPRQAATMIVDLSDTSNPPTTATTTTSQHLPPPPHLPAVPTARKGRPPPLPLHHAEIRKAPATTTSSAPHVMATESGTASKDGHCVTQVTPDVSVSQLPHALHGSLSSTTSSVVVTSPLIHFMFGSNNSNNGAESGGIPPNQRTITTATTTTCNVTHGSELNKKPITSPTTRSPACEPPLPLPHVSSTGGAAGGSATFGEAHHQNSSAAALFTTNSSMISFVKVSDESSASDGGAAGGAGGVGVTAVNSGNFCSDPTTGGPAATATSAGGGTFGRDISSSGFAQNWAVGSSSSATHNTSSSSRAILSSIPMPPTLQRNVEHRGQLQFAALLAESDKQRSPPAAIMVSQPPPHHWNGPKRALDHHPPHHPSHHPPSPPQQQHPQQRLTAPRSPQQHHHQQGGGLPYEEQSDTSVLLLGSLLGRSHMNYEASTTGGGESEPHHHHHHYHDEQSLNVPEVAACCPLQQRERNNGGGVPLFIPRPQPRNRPVSPAARMMKPQSPHSRSASPVAFGDWKPIGLRSPSPHAAVVAPPSGLEPSSLTTPAPVSPVSPVSRGTTANAVASLPTSTTNGQRPLDDDDDRGSMLPHTQEFPHAAVPPTIVFNDPSIRGVTHNCKVEEEEEDAAGGMTTTEQDGSGPCLGPPLRRRPDARAPSLSLVSSAVVQLRPLVSEKSEDCSSCFASRSRHDDDDDNGDKREQERVSRGRRLRNRTEEESIVVSGGGCAPPPDPKEPTAAHRTEEHRHNGSRGTRQSRSSDDEVEVPQPLQGSTSVLCERDGSVVHCSSSSRTLFLQGSSQHHLPSHLMTSAVREEEEGAENTAAAHVLGAPPSRTCSLFFTSASGKSGGEHSVVDADELMSLMVQFCNPAASIQGGGGGRTVGTQSCSGSAVLTNSGRPLANSGGAPTLVSLVQPVRLCTVPVPASSHSPLASPRRPHHQQQHHYPQHQEHEESPQPSKGVAPLLVGLPHATSASEARVGPTSLSSSPVPPPSQPLLHHNASGGGLAATRVQRMVSSGSCSRSVSPRPHRLLSDDGFVGTSPTDDPQRSLLGPRSGPASMCEPFAFAAAAFPPTSCSSLTATKPPPPAAPQHRQPTMSGNRNSSRNHLDDGNTTDIKTEELCSTNNMAEAPVPTSDLLVRRHGACPSPQSPPNCRSIGGGGARAALFSAADSPPLPAWCSSSSGGGGGSSSSSSSTTSLLLLQRSAFNSGSSHPHVNNKGRGSQADDDDDDDEKSGRRMGNNGNRGASHPQPCHSARTAAGRHAQTSAVAATGAAAVVVKAATPLPTIGGSQVRTLCGPLPPPASSAATPSASSQQSFSHNNNNNNSASSSSSVLLQQGGVGSNASTRYTIGRLWDSAEPSIRYSTHTAPTFLPTQYLRTSSISLSGTTSPSSIHDKLEKKRMKCDRRT